MRISDWSSDVCSSDLAAVSALGIVDGRGVRLLAGERPGCFVAACGAAGQERAGYVGVAVVDVAQQPVVAISVGLAAVGDQLPDAADRREFLELVGCLVRGALGRPRRVGTRGGAGPLHAHTPDLAAVEGLG